ncbi:MAG: DUF4174 domain-containing protein [Pseudomonadota bacterium]
MIRYIYLSLTAVVAAALATSPSAADTDPLAKYVGSDRPIVIFAPDRYDNRLREQIGRFSIHRREFRDRDVVVVEIGGPFMRDRGNAVPHGPIMREKFGIRDDEFAIFLVGKDGDVKHRLGEVTDAQVFYDLIDQMPMRRQELGLE